MPHASHLNYTASGPVETQTTQSAQSARSAQSAVCSLQSAVYSLHGLRFNMTVRQAAGCLKTT